MDQALLWVSFVPQFNVELTNKPNQHLMESHKNRYLTATFTMFWWIELWGFFRWPAADNTNDPFAQRISIISIRVDRVHDQSVVQILRFS